MNDSKSHASSAPGTGAETTHFGYQQVATAEKASRVGAVFDSVANNYDLMNDLMSLGIHRAWKHFTLELAAIRPGERVLDVAGGTGDLAEGAARRVGADGHVTCSDINESMLENGRDRLADAGLVANVDFQQADAEALPFDDGVFDCVMIGFGLRNVTNKDAALAEMTRVTRPGGRVLILEFSKPTVTGLGAIYDRYSFTVLPWLGRHIARDEDSYRYLAESIRMHPDQATLEAMMADAGLVRCAHYNLTGGIVAVHRGYRP